MLLIIRIERNLQNTKKFLQ